MRRAFLICAVAFGLLGGCTQDGAGSSRHLGPVSYVQAFRAAEVVMREQFKVESADPDTGEIRSRPVRVSARSERLVSALAGLEGSPARRVALLRLRPSGSGVTAYASVEVQRQDSAVYREGAADAENYDSVPNKTPAEIEAATTPEQNEIWRTERRDRAAEEQLLDRLYARLNPSKK